MSKFIIVIKSDNVDFDIMRQIRANFRDQEIDAAVIGMGQDDDFQIYRATDGKVENVEGEIKDAKTVGLSEGDVVALYPLKT